MDDKTIPRATFLGILLCFFFSGAAGLIYQVAWGKALGLIFGHTVYAVAVVIAVFMGGLALGSAWLGSWSERQARPVTLYGWVELGVAATGMLSLVGLAGVRALYLTAHPLLAESTPALIAVRLIASALVLFLPTFLMGGTLPILVRGLTRTSAELGVRLSRLYWVNTAGAVAGTLAAGFLFLPWLGLRLTVSIAVAFNVLAGSVALLLSRRMPAPLAAAPVAATPANADEARPSSLLAGFALVGATAMAYEVAWTRLLATMLGSSTYAFTLMLATFLAGIVLGSLLFERWAPAGRRVTLGMFAATQTLTALAALLFLVFFSRLPQFVPMVLRASAESFTGLVVAQFVVSALAMLPAAIVFGFNFPLVTVLIAGRPETSGHYAAAVGRAYAANTLGAILGALLAGFWLVPKLGSFRLVAVAAAANLALALVLGLRRATLRVFGFAVNAGLLAVALSVVLTGAFYNRALAHFSTVLYWDLYKAPVTLAEVADTTDLLFAEDGLNASISVARAEDYLGLRTNGKVDASTRDTVTQLLVGHLGAIFHPAPQRVLVIGFGSGMTVSAVARHPEVQRIDCVEIEPAVIRAAQHLEVLHRGVLRDPRLRIILDDARNFLLTTRERYDLIISEPSNPWIAGVATLFTAEYYREARARLRPGGVFLQWIQLYSLYPEDLRMVLATFVPQFPQVTLWHGQSADLFLLARPDRAPLNLDRLRSLWKYPAVRADFETLGLRQPEGLLTFYMLDDRDLRRAAGVGPRNTDDHTRLEYRAPLALLAGGLEDKNRDLLLRERSSPQPQDLDIAVGDTALLAAAETALNLEDAEMAEAFLSQLDGGPESAHAALVRGRAALLRNRYPEATAAFQAALRLDMSLLEAAHGLAEIAYRQFQLDSAELLLRQLLARAPKYAPALHSMALLERARERWEEAAEWQARYIAADPQVKPEAHARLGEMLLSAGKLDLAAATFLKTLEREPCSYSAHHNLGLIYRQRKRWDLARHHLELTARYFPDGDAGVYLMLADAYRALGQPRKAAGTLRKGLRIFPSDAELRKAAPKF